MRSRNEQLRNADRLRAVVRTEHFGTRHKPVQVSAGDSDRRNVDVPEIFGEFERGGCTEQRMVEY